MSTMKVFPRYLWLFLVMLVLAVLVWRFGYNSNYFYYSLGAAVAVTGLAALAIFKIRSRSQAVETAESETTSRESGEARARGEETELEEVKQDIVSDPVRPSILAAASQPIKPREETRAKSPPQAEDIETAEPDATVEVIATGEPPVPMIEDQSSLTLEEINELVNAVWYRCENPYCKYTSFLTVHHFVDEKDGGTNKLDNLIVLCPYCHDLAHKNEMPEEEMHEWVSRDDRFKFKPDWHSY